MKNVLRLLTVALCLLAGVASAQGTVKIGVIAEFSGPFADYGAQILGGMKTYLKHLHAVDNDTRLSGRQGPQCAINPARSEDAGNWNKKFLIVVLFLDSCVFKKSKFTSFDKVSGASFSSGLRAGVAIPW